MPAARLANIDVSRLAWRFRVVHLTDFALIYGSVQIGLQSLLEVLFDPVNVWSWFVEIFFIGFASWSLVIGLRNIGTISSRTWTSYRRLLYVLLPVCLAMALSLIGATFDGPGTMMAILFFGVAVIWITVTLFAIFGIKSMPITGLAINLAGLSQVMRDDGRMASAAVRLSQVKRVNRGMGILFGCTGGLVLIASAVGWHWVNAHHAAESMNEFRSMSNLFNGLDLLGFFLLLRMRRYFQIDADALLRVDHRAPILFLRSFEDEEKQQYAASGEALFDYSLETRLSRHFMAFGPFVAIGAPKESLPIPGAARMILSNADWQDQVRSWMGSAQVILMYCGNTYWVTWELAMLARKDCLAKLILVFPPRKGWAKRSRKTRDDLAGRLGKVKDALRDSAWKEALSALEPEANLRVLIFHSDGTVTAVRSKQEHRDAYHLAVLVGHFVLHTTVRKPSRMAFLRLKGGADPQSQWPIRQGKMHIGAAQQNDIALLHDDFVSRQHACIECTGSEIVVADLGSRNGTFVNGVALSGQRRPLKAGDEVRIGTSVFELAGG